ncbi:MAG TPA: hypothetical protein PLA50_11550, partial [Bacteroidia bacterium]|nr:hypothetical protein [Bacteroidia bacterium]
MTPKPASSRSLSLKEIAIRYGLALLVGLPATLLAGAVGGAVLHIAAFLSFEEVTLESLPGMIVMGIIFGSLAALPVTLGVLPIAAIFLRRMGRLHWPVWLALGTIAGVCRTWLGSEGTDPFVSILVASALGGLAAGAVFALA